MRVWVCIDDTQVEIETESKYSPDVIDDLIRRATETVLSLYAGVSVIDEKMTVMTDDEDENEEE